MVDFSGAFGNFGTGIGDLFAANGQGIAASGFDEAARREQIAAKISAGSTIIKHAAAQRDIERAVEGQRADVGGAGFQFSGSAIDLARDSAQQGAISQALIENQGQIEVGQHIAKAAEYQSDAAQSRNAQTGSTLGGIISFAAGIFSLFSDERLKDKIQRIGVDTEGKNVYEFEYKALPGVKWKGYIAQELDPATVTDAVGFLSPDETHRSVRV